MYKKFFILTLFIFIGVFNAPAQKALENIPQRPQPKRLVNDMANLLNDPAQTAALETKLNALNDSLGVEIFVVTIKSLRNIDVNTYANKLADRWEDENDKENGMFILYDFEDRGYAIIPGTNFEEKFDQTIIKKIEGQFLKPYFKKEKYYEGFNLATDAIANHITGKLTDVELKKDDSFGIYPITIAILLFFLFFFPIYQYRQFKKHHFGSKRIGFLSAFLMTNNLKTSKSTFEDFQKGKGPFSISGGHVTSFGGGAGGSWGGW